MNPAWRPPPPKKPQSAWLGPERVARITVRRVVPGLAPVNIGEGFKKKVYLGTIHFRVNTPTGPKLARKTIVIKKFKVPLTDEQAIAYNRLINDLHGEGRPIPKGGLYKVTHEIAPGLSGIAATGEWIAVQQFFGRGAKTKIIDRWPEVERKIKMLRARGIPLTFHTDYSLLFHGKRLERTEAVKFLANLADSGYVPKSDVVAPLKRGKGRAGAIPFDFDLIVDELIKARQKPTEGDLANHLIDAIKQLSPDVRERRRLFSICMSEVKSPKIKEFLEFLKGDLSQKGEEHSHNPAIDLQN